MNPPKYFTRKENVETISKTLVVDYTNMQVETKPSYTYRSGAKYTGQWAGGFRHGQGVMVWEDGATYTG